MAEAQSGTAAVIGRFHGRFVHGRRAHVLAQHFVEMIPRGAAVLDVGCGDGLVGRLIAEQRPDISIEGIDTLVRAEAHIPVTQFDGKTIPRPDKSFDAVLLVDVVHHTEDPMRLLGEVRRIAGTSVLIKDHIRDAVGANLTLRFMDWMGNAPHGVALPYNYWTTQRWRAAFTGLGLRVIEWRGRLGLYAPPASWIFERSLHFVARLDVAR